MTLNRRLGMGWAWTRRRRRRGRELGLLQSSLLLPLLLPLFFLCQVSLCFNLDWRIPVVKLAPGDSLPGAYFGYSVSQHRTARGSRGEPVILVGAPRDDNLQPGTNRSGALYRCPVSADTRVRKKRERNPYLLFSPVLFIIPRGFCAGRVVGRGRGNGGRWGGIKIR